jgi:hypothetical protein
MRERKSRAPQFGAESPDPHELRKGQWNRVSAVHWAVAVVALTDAALRTGELLCADRHPARTRAPHPS